VHISRFFTVFLAICTIVFGTVPQAYAEFRVCNKTSGRIGVAIGVNQGPIRITQGWFNIKANTCETPIKEDLKEGPYFIYAVDYDHGGEWGGTDLLCVKDREFYIEGNSDCYARGFDRLGFRQIATKNLKNWTIDLNDTKSTPAQTGGAAGKTSSEEINKLSK
jgi:uncharacterized membrane protein